MLNIFSKLIVSVFIIKSSFAQSHLPAELQSQIHSQYFAQAEKDQRLQDLLKKTLEISKFKNLREFIAQIKACDPQQMQGGKVTHRNEFEILFIPRDLDEPDFKNDSELKSHYKELAQKNISAQNQNSEWIWKINPDLIQLYVGHVTKEICLRPNLPENQTFEYLAHEMLHYTKLNSKNIDFDILIFKDCIDYASRTAIEPGNEVEAYTLEYSLRIQKEGKAFLKDRPEIANLFDKQGHFLGPQSTFTKYIVDTLNYKKFIFFPQFNEHVQTQIRFENQKLNALQGLKKSRQDELDNIKKWISGRAKIYNTISSKYRKETDRGQFLLDKINKSLERIQAEILSTLKRIDQLKERSQSCSKSQ